MRSSSEVMYRARQVSNLGGFMSGVNNNGAHSANGITAMFIATGQDAANVAESSAAFVYAELRDNGDYYYSVTIPSLIVATYGGGTGLATQRECLELLGCYGKGKVRKFAEIVAATVLCGELSLGSAIVAEEWVNAHDLLGRNRQLTWRLRLRNRPDPLDERQQHRAREVLAPQRGDLVAGAGHGHAVAVLERLDRVLGDLRRVEPERVRGSARRRRRSRPARRTRCAPGPGRRRSRSRRCRASPRAARR